MTSNHFDVIVIGVGTMGSAACWFLAKRGFKVLGLEQFDIVHDNGSHGGQSRIIRKAYFEHPDYVPLLHRSYENWKSLEKSADVKIYQETGIVYFGKSNSQTIHGVNESAKLYQIPLKQISETSYPQFRIPEGFETVFEPEAGFLSPELAIKTFVAGAEEMNAVIKSNEQVLNWKQIDSKIEVETNSNRYSCDKLIITAGSWTSKVLPSLPINLEVTRQVLAWFKPDNVQRFLSPDFPCWFIEDERGIFYGFPYQQKSNLSSMEGLKVALHKRGTVTDPNHVVREVTASDLEDLRFAVSAYLPDAGDKIISSKTCLYTYSADENFIIDFLPGYGNKVTIACGFSGHGFKFASVVGEILADLSVKGKTELPVDFLSLKRFSKIQQ